MHHHRILMTTDAISGVWDYSLELTRQMSRHGFQTVLAVMGPEPTEHQRHAAVAVPGLELHVHPCRLEWMEDAEGDVIQSGNWLLELERQCGCDLVHINGYAHAALPFHAPVVLVAHSCVQSWWEAVHGQKAPPSWATYARWVRNGLDAADTVVAPTQGMLDALQACHGTVPHGVVIRNGRDPKRFSPAPKRQVIFSAGRLWDEAKNLSALDDIALDLPWPVQVAGSIAHPDGTMRPPYHVGHLGSLQPHDMAETLGSAAIFVAPARYEPFGLSILEAAFSGCALVLGDIPTLRELWSGAAVFVPSDDRQALREAICNLIENETARIDMARMALSRAHLYTAAAMGHSYHDLYRQLIEESCQNQSRVAALGE